jgi:hypothetical protein
MTFSILYSVQMVPWSLQTYKVQGSLLSLTIDFMSREREEKEKRSPSVRRRSKSPRPVPRRRTRIVPRYMVQIPKIALDM